MCSPLVGIRLDLEGEEHLTGLLKARGGKGQCAVLIGNHQRFVVCPAFLIGHASRDVDNSLLDILYLGRVLPKHSAIMAKKELMWVPLLGQFRELKHCQHHGLF